MKKILLSLFSLLSIYSAHSQITESFTDGDFTTGLAWAGTTSNWQIVANSDVAAGASNSNTLRLNASAGGTSYLSTQPASWGTQQAWGVWIGRRAQTVSASNRSYLWLWASEADVTSATVDGYRIFIGDNASDEEIHLEKVTNGVGTEILASTGAIANNITDYGLLVRITRSSGSTWNMYTSALPTANGTGALATSTPNSMNTPFSQGAVVDNTYTNFTNGFIAVAALHSTGATALAGAEFDQIIFSTTGDIPLPVTMANFKALQRQNAIQLQWTNLTEKEVVSYEVERSYNGKDYSLVKAIAPLKNEGGRADYTFTDASPLPGNNFYRIKVVETSGKVVYTSIIKMNTKATGVELSILSNPVRNKTLSYYIPNFPAGKYVLRVTNMIGQVIYSENIVHSGGSLAQPLLIGNLREGMYNLSIRGNTNLQKQFVAE